MATIDFDFDADQDYARAMAHYRKELPILPVAYILGLDLLDRASALRAYVLDPATVVTPALASRVTALMARYAERVQYLRDRNSFEDGPGHAVYVIDQHVSGLARELRMIARESA